MAHCGPEPKPSEVCGKALISMAFAAGPGLRIYGKIQLYPWMAWGLDLKISPTVLLPGATAHTWLSRDDASTDCIVLALPPSLLLRGLSAQIAAMKSRCSLSLGPLARQQSASCMASAHACSRGPGTRPARLPAPWPRALQQRSARRAGEVAIISGGRASGRLWCVNGSRATLGRSTATACP